MMQSSWKYCLYCVLSRSKILKPGGGEGLIDFMNGLVHSESISFVEILF